MEKKSFLYIPSFSVGYFATLLAKNYYLTNNLPARFYADDFPKLFRHNSFLLTAGHFYKKMNTFDSFGFDRKKHLVLGDSGGYQIASGALTWSNDLRYKIFNWLENNSTVAMNLDIPPRMNNIGKWDECIAQSEENFKYFYEKQTGKTEFLNVLQGTNETSYKIWYDRMKKFEFSGWAIGGAGGILYRLISSIAVLLDGKEHLKTSNKYLHMLGSSSLSEFFILAQLQKSLNDIGSSLQVMTDSSSPSFSVAFGTYYTAANLKKCVYSTVNVPKQKQHSIDNNMFLPKTHYFDALFNNVLTPQDIFDYKEKCICVMTLHNFFVLKDTITAINEFIYNDPYLLQEVTDPNLFIVLKSIDEMVKNDNSMKVFEKYKPAYVNASKLFDSSDDTHINTFFEF
ncbi:hypothetical protein M0P65_07630 [Candidatus Gracilibacteria bacterium]|jgi:hypothetical protein|nr:hypothetical protein [Candidatus Gracilibacteria bacterium]